MAYATTLNTRARISIAWSWNFTSCSIVEEAASWKNVWPQNLIACVKKL